jgi:hypothetical protein
MPQDHESAELDAWRAHVDDRLNTQDEKLDELLAILRASRMGAEIIKWLAGLGLTLLGAWAAWRGIR